MAGKKTDTSNNAKKAVKNLQGKVNTKENGRTDETVLRRRRAQSIGRVEDETERENRFKKDNPDNPLVFFFESAPRISPSNRFLYLLQMPQDERFALQLVQ